ncbi:MAG: type IX secretion system membrane protein PorP/SprF [Flavobacteriales bacterium]|nr:type IX secretion system membrane protein PorP/SprF [Flavobacteriales bacterium]
MKSLVTILIFVGIGVVSFGQQQYVFTNYMLNDYYYNPAIAGSRNVHMANLTYRSQWTGFDEAPVSLMGNFYGSIRNEGKHGYGVSILSDKTGLTQNTGVYLNYAYHLKLSETLKLGFGIKPGYMQYRVRLYDAQLADQGDDVLTGNVLSANAIDLSSGFHLYSEKFFLMIAMQHLLGDAITFTSYNQSLSKHFTMVGGYNFSLDKKKLEFQPSLMLRYVNPVPAQVSIMFKTTYDKKYWLGLSYRSQDAIGLALGLKVKDRLNIGYAFDYSLGGIQAYQSGSHEIMISFITTSNKPTLDDEDEELNNSILKGNKKKNKEE